MIIQQKQFEQMSVLVVEQKISKMDLTNNLF